MSNPTLRLDDLASRGKSGRGATKLMNVRLPSLVLDRLGALAKKLRTSKTEVVIAMMNEGLDVADVSLKGWKPPPKIVISRNRRCTVPGCERQKVALGLCATHYQAQRRGKA